MDESKSQEFKSVKEVKKIISKDNRKKTICKKKIFKLSLLFLKENNIEDSQTKKFDYN